MNTAVVGSVMAIAMTLAGHLAAQPAAAPGGGGPATGSAPPAAPGQPATAPGVAVPSSMRAPIVPSPRVATGAPPPAPAPAPERALPNAKIYGFARLDGTYATQRMFHPQSGYWVLSPSAEGADEAEFVLYPRWSRLGVEVAVAEPAEGVRIDAKVEVDFNNGGSESRASPRMLHAYGQLTLGGLQILAGQTSDLIAPLVYGGLESCIFWYGGNLGDRRPQLRITYGRELGSTKVVLAADVAQSGAVDMEDLDGDNVMDGIASTRPAVQGLAELQFRLDPAAKQPMRIGISGHYGAKRLAFGGKDEDFDVIAGSGHLMIPISIVTLQAEGYLGENLRDLRGGVGQGIELRDLDGDGVMDEGRNIPAMGGFVQFQLDPVAWYSLQVGTGVDNPKGIDAGKAGLNQTAHLGNTFKPYERFVVGLIYDYYHTEYAGFVTRHGVSHRFSVNTMVPF